MINTALGNGLDPGALFAVLLLSYFYIRTLIDVITGRFKMLELEDQELVSKFLRAWKDKQGSLTIKPTLPRPHIGGDNSSITNEKKDVKLNNIVRLPGTYLDIFRGLVYTIKKPKPIKSKAEWIKEQNDELLNELGLAKGNSNVIPAKKTTSDSKVIPFRSGKNRTKE